MPHWSPMMKQRPQITIVEPTISTPACRSASPKNLKTRPRKISPNTRAQNFAMSPKEATQSFGTASQPGISTPRSARSRASRLRRGLLTDRSFNDRDFRMRGEQRLGEDVVEREDAQQRGHHRLVHGAAHALGAAGRGHPLVATDDRDDRPEQGGLHDRPPEVDGRGVRQQRGEERPERRAEG